MPATLRFALYLVALTATATALLLSSGKLVLTAHVGDVLHALESGYRMVDGEVPHLDFMTPIGILGFAPIALFLSLGFAPGASLVLSNTLVTALLLPATVWIGSTRFEGWARRVFGTVIVLYGMAFLYGGIAQATSFSMHYNRWAWAITFLVLTTLLIPSRGQPRPVIEALIIGLGLSALALMKMTFFISFGGATLLILLASRRFRLMGMVAVVGAAVALFVTLLFGIDFWFAYAGNLLEVAVNSPRPYPDRDMMSTLVAPDRVLGTLAYLLAIVVLRGTGARQQGLALLILAPAFVYVMFQNWGNEQKWLVFLGLFLVANMPPADARAYLGIPARKLVTGLLVVIATLIVPPMLTMSASFLKAPYFNEATARQIPFSEGPRDLWITKRGNLLRSVVMSFTETGLPPGEDPADFPPQVFQGEELPRCILQSGYLSNVYEGLKLVASVPEAANAELALADNVNNFWMFSDIKRLRGGAPWYYSGTYGYENADYFLVPLCPKGPLKRKEAIQAMESTGWQFDEAARSDTYILYKILR